MPNPLTQQGLLNRVLTNVVVTSYPQLSVTAPFMSKSLAHLTFEGAAVDQIGTATGVVNSPMPYVLGQVVINLLRSQPIAALYFAQWQAKAVLGTVIVYPDSTALGPFTLSNCSLLDLDPGAFDGQDATTKATLKGVYYVNASLWSPTVI
jgi:hypothetical protein